MAVALTAGALVVALGALALALWLSRTDRIVTSHMRQRYVVTLKSAEAFDGFLERADTHSLSLVRARSLAPSRDPLPVDGVLILPRAEIAYMQCP